MVKKSTEFTSPVDDYLDAIDLQMGQVEFLQEAFSLLKQIYIELSTEENKAMSPLLYKRLEKFYMGLD